MVVSERTTEGNVKFISYDGHYPNLCSGTLELEVNGKRYRYGSTWVSERDKKWTTQEIYQEVINVIAQLRSVENA